MRFPRKGDEHVYSGVFRDVSVHASLEDWIVSNLENSSSPEPHRISTSTATSPATLSCGASMVEVSHFPYSIPAEPSWIGNGVDAMPPQGASNAANKILSSGSIMISGCNPCTDSEVAQG